MNLRPASRSDDYDQGKDIHYRMHPEHWLLTAARFTCGALANNHVPDMGAPG
jgi:hypothetical protein